MNRAADLTPGRSLTLALLTTAAVAGAAAAVGIPMWLLDGLHDASQPFTTWEQLLQSRPGRAVKLKGRILASVAPSHAGFAAYHKCESYEDSNGNTKWRTVLSDEPDLLLELSADGPSAKVLAGYEFEAAPERDIGAFRYWYIPLEQEVWLLGTFHELKETPIETERVNSAADAGPVQKLPVIKAKFISCQSVEDYLFSERWHLMLWAIPGGLVSVIAIVNIRACLKRWASNKTSTN